MKMNIVNQTEFKINAPKLALVAKKVIASLRLKKIRNSKKLELNNLVCVFLTVSEMKKINYHFRKKNKPTDVLSFSSIEPDCIGELLFCPEVLRKQAHTNGHSESSELLYLLIHGLLHLLGYDHELSKKEEKLMFKIQDDLFRQLTQQNIDLNYIRP